MIYTRITTENHNPPMNILRAKCCFSHVMRNLLSVCLCAVYHDRNIYGEPKRHTKGKKASVL